MNNEEQVAMEEMASRIESALPFEPHEVLPEYEDNGWLECYHNRNGGMLWHYCGPETVNGIFENKEIWASDLRFTSDSGEFKYGLKMAEEVLRQAERTRNADEHKRIWRLLEALHQHGSGATAFIFCMSQLDDDLSQWRGYCPNGGYAVGFEVRRLKYYATRAGFRLARCIYGEQACRALMTRLVNEALTKLELSKVAESVADEATRTQRERELAEDAISSIVSAAATLKSDKFQAEVEWRLISEPEQVFTHQPQVGVTKLRAARELLIPYRVISLERPDIPRDLVYHESQTAFIQMMYWPAPGMRVAPTMDSDLGWLTMSMLYQRLPFIPDLILAEHSGVTLRRVGG